MTTEKIVRIISELPEYVLSRISTLIETYLEEKKSADGVVFEYCPKCGMHHPSLIKAGKSRSGKQLYRCKFCGSRFVEDINGLTYRSHLPDEQWNEFIKLSLAGYSLSYIASSLKINENTAFNLRHKLMHTLEQEETQIVIKDAAELDEKYVMKSHKGLHIKGIKGKKRGEPASKRGLSDEKVCLLTAVQRDGESFLRSYNMAKPGSAAVMNLRKNIQDGTFLWTDGLSSYNDLAAALGSDKMVLKDRNTYTKVNHLNTVNSFHSAIADSYRDMRGVASKYINRYAALFNIRWITKSMKPSEALFHVKARLGRIVNGYFRIEDILETDIFQPSNLVWSA